MNLDAFAIDKKSDIPIWAQIRQRIMFLITSGAFKSGDQLPTVRELAVELDVNYHTVNKAYHDLETSGLVEMRAGRGTYVADLSNARFLIIEGGAHAIIVEYTAKLLELGMTPTEIVSAVAEHLHVAIQPADGHRAAAATEERREKRAG